MRCGLPGHPAPECELEEDLLPVPSPHERWGPSGAPPDRPSKRGSGGGAGGGSGGGGGGGPRPRVVSESDL